MISIIKSVILKSIREPKYVIFSALFPIFLTVLLGSVLKNDFQSKKSTEEKKTIYYLQSQKDEEIIKILNQIIKDEDLNYSMKEIKSVEEGKDLARKDNNLVLNLEKDKLDIYCSNSDNIEYKEISSIITSVEERGAVIELAFKNNPRVAGEIEKNEEYGKGKIVEIKDGVSQTSFDYYGIVEITMIILYLMPFSLYKLDEDRRKSIFKRGRLSGMSNLEYYGGTMIGYFILAAFIILIPFLFNQFILKTNWGEQPLIVYGAMLLFAFAIISIGIVIARIAKDPEKAMVITEGFIFPVFAFLGGAYMALPDNVGGFFQILTNISPLRWLNRGIFQFIYIDDAELLTISVVSSIAIVIICIVIIRILSIRREDRI